MRSTERTEGLPLKRQSDQRGTKSEPQFEGFQERIGVQLSMNIGDNNFEKAADASELTCAATATRRLENFEYCAGSAVRRLAAIILRDCVSMDKESEGFIIQRRLEAKYKAEKNTRKHSSNGSLKISGSEEQ